MAEAYRFNGPVPEAVKQLRERRRFRGSQLYQTIKRGRRQKAVDCALATSGVLMPWIAEQATVYDPTSGAISTQPDIERNWHGAEQ